MSGRRGGRLLPGASSRGVVGHGPAGADSPPLRSGLDCAAKAVVAVDWLIVQPASSNASMIRWRSPPASAGSPRPNPALGSAGRRVCGPPGIRLPSAPRAPAASRTCPANPRGWGSTRPEAPHRAAHDEKAHGLATTSSRPGRRPAPGESWPRHDGLGSPARARRCPRYRARLPSEPGRSFLSISRVLREAGEPSDEAAAAPRSQSASARPHDVPRPGPLGTPNCGSPKRSTRTREPVPSPCGPSAPRRRADRLAPVLRGMRRRLLRQLNTSSGQCSGVHPTGTASIAKNVACRRALIRNLQSEMGSLCKEFRSDSRKEAADAAFPGNFLGYVHFARVRHQRSRGYS